MPQFPVTSQRRNQYLLITSLEFSLPSHFHIPGWPRPSISNLQTTGCFVAVSAQWYGKRRVSTRPPSAHLVFLDSIAIRSSFSFLVAEVWAGYFCLILPISGWCAIGALVVICHARAARIGWRLDRWQSSRAGTSKTRIIILTSRLCLCTFTNCCKRATQVEFKVSAGRGTSGRGGGQRLEATEPRDDRGGRRTSRRRVHTTDTQRTRDFATARQSRKKEGADTGEDGRSAAGMSIARVARLHAGGGGKVDLALFARGVGCPARGRDRTRLGRGEEWGSGRGGR